MLEAGWRGTSCQRAVDNGEDAGAGSVEDILQEGSGDTRGQVEGFMVATIFVREGSVMGWKQSSFEEQTSEMARSRLGGNDVQSNILNLAIEEI